MFRKVPMHPLITLAVSAFINSLENTTVNKQQLNAAFDAFCHEAGIVMDSAEDQADFALRGHLFDDPGSDAHDHQPMP